VHRDDSVRCCSERGRIIGIEADGGSTEQVTTDNFRLGMAFDVADHLFVWDLKHAAIFRFDARSGEPTTFTDGADVRRRHISNHPAFNNGGRTFDTKNTVGQ
jgi:sugar lactone lactonase YvrE